MNDEAATAAEERTPDEKVSYSVSPGFSTFLGSRRIALAISSYQSGKFYLLGQNLDGGLMVHERFFRKAMGICVPDKDTILLATLFQIIRFKNALEPGQQINNLYDACFVPREMFVTGELDAHDIGQLADGRIIFVDTLYNCLATPSERHSFTPFWKPSFISKIVKEDRCHLNGLAMEDGVPRYVTAVSKSDTIDGWRDRRVDGGIVIDVQIERDRCRWPVHAAFAAAASRQALDSQLRHRRDWLDRAGCARRSASSTCSPSVPASCAVSPFTANMPSSVCRSRATSASRDWCSTASSPRPTRSPGAGCR